MQKQFLRLGLVAIASILPTLSASANPIQGSRSLKKPLVSQPSLGSQVLSPLKKSTSKTTVKTTPDSNSVVTPPASSDPIPMNFPSNERRHNILGDPAKVPGGNFPPSFGSHGFPSAK